MMLNNEMIYKVSMFCWLFRVRFLDVTFFFQRRKENAFTHAVWDSAEAIPTKLKTPVSSPDNDPGTTLALNFGALSIGAICQTLASS